MKPFVVLALISGAAFLHALHAQTEPAPPAPAKSKKVMIIPIEGAIDKTQAAYVRRTVARAQKERPDLVIFEINTPGGEGEAMLAICERIASLDSIPTVAYIRGSEKSPYNAAYSAGAFVSFSCKRIYMDPRSVIGAAAPVMIGPQGIIELGEKFVSGFREKLGALAESNGYPKNLALLMVDKEGEEVFEVRVEGQKKFWTRREIELYEREKGTLADKLQHPVIEKGKLLTVSAKLAVEYGIATKMISRRPEIYSDYGLTAPVEIEEALTWSEDLVGWLTNPIVAGVLTMLGILGIWVELKTPGFGIPGIVGILAFAILLFGHHLVGLAEVPEILMVFLGLLFIVVELFLVPGTGVFAVMGVICFFVGLILSMSFQGLEWPKGRVAWESLQGPAMTVVVSFISASAVFVFLLRFLPRVPMFSRLALQTEIGSTVALAPEVSSYEVLINKTGVAVTTLRPAGKIDIGGTTYDVVAHGDFIEKDERVQVIQIEGTRIVVDRIGQS